MSDRLCPGFPTSSLQELGCTLAEAGGGFGFIFVLALLLAGGAWYIWRRRLEEEAESDGPPIVFPAWSPDAPVPATTSTPGRGDGTGVPIPSSSREPRRSPRPAEESPRGSDGARPRRPEPWPAGPDWTEEDSTAVDAGPVRFHRPPDGTLQLLPGRLEIVSGAGVGEEIRFVRLPAMKPAVTFGRSSGPPHEHVQLRSPTVSRLHARFRFNGGRWIIANLSATNPTIVNGTPLLSEAEQVELSDGDRIEMGEIAFVFHQQEIQDRLPFRSSWYTDRGRRAANQDAVVVRTLPDGRELAVVCDGMGSHAAGGVASHLALEAVTEALKERTPLREAVERANGVVWEEAHRAADRDGMATTLVALLREGESYTIANVGDSRAYRVEATGIEQVTRDHSFSAEAIRNGELSSTEASRSPWKNAVTRMLGSDEHVEVDLYGPFPASEPHLIVLCSDGIHGVFPKEDLLKRILEVPEIEDLAKDLGEEALRRGSKDNVGVAALAFAGGVARVKEPESV